MNLDTFRIAVIGLGYVGLPLAVEFGKHRPVVGFDVNATRIADLRSGHDGTREVTTEELTAASQLQITNDRDALKDCGVFIITVPTPVDMAKRPNLTPLISASETVGAALKLGDVVIYESTVFPGCTQEICVPVLERTSGLTHNVDFFTGYSPERINPGDKLRRLTTICKVTSGSTPEAAQAIDALYAKIIEAGTHMAPSIAVAEAAKVIENTQRDVNIALMNELSLLFHKMGIDTLEVLEAAGTKWNFLPFRPGLVGGHCIGVDPYYLTHKAIEVGHHPEVIMAGRRINDAMGPYVADRVARLMMRAGFPVVGSKILVMGLTFKEDCPDLRNSKVIDVIEALHSYNAQVEVHDPQADPSEAYAEYGIDLITTLEPDRYDAIVLAVNHKQYRETASSELRALGRKGVILFDVKGLFPRDESDGRL